MKQYNFLPFNNLKFFPFTLSEYAFIGTKQAVFMLDHLLSKFIVKFYASRVIAVSINLPSQYKKTFPYIDKCSIY